MLTWIQDNIAVAVTTGILLTISSTIFTGFQSVISYKQNKRFEEHKNRLTIEQSKFNSVLSTYSTESQSTIEKRLVGLEQSWDNMFKLKGEVSGFINFYGLITPKEYDYSDVREKLLGGIRLSDSDYSQILTTSFEQLNRDRIYLGDEFYALCRTYLAFLARLAFITNLNLDKGIVNAWTDDNHLLTMLEFIEKDVDKGMSPMDIFRVLDQCETKILSVGRKIISGEKTALDNHEIMRRFRETVEPKV